MWLRLHMAWCLCGLVELKLTTGVDPFYSGVVWSFPWGARCYVAFCGQDEAGYTGRAARCTGWLVMGEAHTRWNWTCCNMVDPFAFAQFLFWCLSQCPANNAAEKKQELSVRLMLFVVRLDIGSRHGSRNNTFWCERKMNLGFMLLSSNAFETVVSILEVVYWKAFGGIKKSSRLLAKKK